MLKKEFYNIINGKALFRIYSDTNHKILEKSTGDIYDEVVNVILQLSDYEELEEEQDESEENQNLS